MKKLSAILSAALIFTQLYVPVFAESTNTRAEELTLLIEQCESAGISAEYEKSALEILKYFESLGNILGAADQEYIDGSLENVYEDAKSNLELYLAGKKEPKIAPSYQTGSLRVQGADYFGMVSDGEASWEQPVFLTGLGHWYYVRNNLELFKRLGINHIQTEIKMNEVLVKPQAVDAWEIVHQLGDPTEVELSETEKKNGKKSLHMHAESYPWKQNQLTAVRQKVYVQPNTTYQIAFFVKRSGAYSFWFSPNGLGKGTEYIDLYQAGADNGWKRYTKSYTTGAEETELDLTFVNEGRADDIYIDNVLVYQTNENLVENPSFETAGNPYCHINYDKIDEYCEFLKEAEKNGITVDLLLAVHNPPSFMLEDHPELAYKGYGFFPYDPLLEGSKEFIRQFVRGVCGRAKHYSSLVSVCMTNEPSYISAANPEVYDPAWQQYLSEQYSTPQELSLAYQKSYQNFSDCSLSEMNWWGGYDSKNKMYLDYKHFNDRLFSEWYRWLGNEIKSYIPGIRVHSKIIQYMGGDDRFVVRSQIHNGMNMETLKDITDLNGYDQGATIRNQYAYEACDLWNDFCRSVHFVPNVNSENHIVNGTSEETAQAIYSMLWQGALHGLSQTALWIWDNDYDRANKAGHDGELMNLKPEHLWKLSCVSKDLLRLGEEITALRNAPPRVGILFSETSRNYSSQHMAAVMRAYQAAEFLGEGVRILTDTSCDVGGLETIIVPEAEYVPDLVYETLQQYSGNLILLGENSLSKDEDGNNRGNFLGAAKSVQTCAAAFDGLTIQTPELKPLMTTLLGTLNRRAVSIENAQTGEMPVGISWQYTETDGKKLLSLCNYTDQPIQLRINGAAGWRERISEEQMSTIVTAEPDIPLLLEEDEPIDRTLSKISADSDSQEQLLRSMGASIQPTDGGFTLRTNRDAAVWVDGRYAGRTENGIFEAYGLVNDRQYEITLAAASGGQTAGRFYKTLLTPTKRRYADRDEYDPVNPLLNVYWGKIKLSWRNPKTSLLQRVSVYRGDTLLSSAFSTAPEQMNTFFAENTDPGTAYRLVLEYSNGVTREISLSGSGKPTIGEDWSVLVNHRNDPEKMYSYRVYRTEDAPRSGSYALCVDTNYNKQYDGTYLYLENSSFVSLKKDTAYRLGAWIRTDRASSIKGMIGENECWLIPRSGDLNGETVTNHGWRFYSVRFTAASDEDEAIVRLFFDEGGETCVDDLTLYKLDQNNNQTGENLMPNGGFESAERTFSEVQGLSLESRRDGLVLSWANPEENFTGLEIRRNGKLAARLGTGVESVKLPASDGEELIEVRTINSDGLLSNGAYAEVQNAAVRLLCNGAETDTLIPGQTYTLQTAEQSPDQYLACYQNGRLLSVFRAANGKEFTLPEATDKLVFFRWNKMTPEKQPEYWYQIIR